MSSLVLRGRLQPFSLLLICTSSYKHLPETRAPENQWGCPEWVSPVKEEDHVSARRVPTLSLSRFFALAPLLEML